MCLHQLRLQRHQHGLRFRHLRLLGGDVGAGGAAQLELPAHGVELALLEADQGGLDVDLSP